MKHQHNAKKKDGYSGPDGSPYGISGLSSPDGYNLRIQSINSATVVPTPQKNVWPGTEAGVLNSSLEYVRESGLERRRTRMTDGQEISLSVRPSFVDEEVYFGGYFFDQYGHFLLESLSRVWAFKNSDLRIVWGNTNIPSGYHMDICDRLGILRARHISVSEPTAFKRVHVATPGYIINSWFHSIHVEALKVRSVALSPQKIYLSRNSFSSKIANFVNENVLEEELTRRGWSIVQPHTLSVDDQISIFSSSSVIAGIEGSAFHTAVLCRSVGRKIILVRRKRPNKNFDTIERVMGFEQVNLFDKLRDCMGDAKTAAIIDPVSLANEIEEVARTVGRG